MQLQNFGQSLVHFTYQGFGQVILMPENGCIAGERCIENQAPSGHIIYCKNKARNQAAI
jgi:hypothetical protein